MVIFYIRFNLYKHIYLRCIEIDEEEEEGEVIQMDIQKEISFTCIKFNTTIFDTHTHTRYVILFSIIAPFLFFPSNVYFLILI